MTSTLLPSLAITGCRADVRRAAHRRRRDRIHRDRLTMPTASGAPS
jgi:hypothetical protein